MLTFSLFSSNNKQIISHIFNVSKSQIYEQFFNFNLFDY